MLGTVACNSAKDSPLIGRWALKESPLLEPTVIEFRPNGDFWLNFGRDIVNDFTGEFSVDGNQVTIIYKQGVEDEPDCKGPGVYKYRFVNGELRLDLVSDACSSRKVNNLYPWHRATKMAH